MCCLSSAILGLQAALGTSLQPRHPQHASLLNRDLACKLQQGLEQALVLLASQHSAATFGNFRNGWAFCRCLRVLAGQSRTGGSSAGGGRGLSRCLWVLAGQHRTGGGNGWGFPSACCGCLQAKAGQDTGMAGHFPDACGCLQARAGQEAAVQEVEELQVSLLAARQERDELRLLADTRSKGPTHLFRSPGTIRKIMLRSIHNIDLHHPVCDDHQAAKQWEPPWDLRRICKIW